MAVQSRIDADDQWFVGEDRQFRFTFTAGDTDGIETWTLALELYAGDAMPSDEALVTVAAAGHAAVEGDEDTPAEAAYIVATVPSAESIEIGPGHYQFVIRRTDDGQKEIFGYGPAQLRSVVTAA